MKVCFNGCAIYPELTITQCPHAPSVPHYRVNSLIITYHLKIKSLESSGDVGLVSTNLSYTLARVLRAKAQELHITEEEGRSREFHRHVVQTLGDTRIREKFV